MAAKSSHEEDIERLFFSAKELDMDIPYSQAQIEDACYEALEAEAIKTHTSARSYGAAVA